MSYSTKAVTNCVDAINNAIFEYAGAMEEFVEIVNKKLSGMTLLKPKSDLDITNAVINIYFATAKAYLVKTNCEIREDDVRYSVCGTESFFKVKGRYY